MAKQFNGKTGADVGHLTKVYNIDQHQSAKSKYTTVWLVSEETGEVLPYIFTERELGLPRKRAIQQPEDIPPYHRSWLKRLFFIK